MKPVKGDFRFDPKIDNPSPEPQPLEVLLTWAAKCVHVARELGAECVCATNQCVVSVYVCACAEPGG